MNRCRHHDPLGVSDCPNLVTDPERLAMLIGETKRKLAYLEQHYRFETRFGFEARAFNASVASLRKQVRQARDRHAGRTRLHPLLELRITSRAKELAGLSAGDILGEDQAAFVAEAVRWTAANVTAIRGTPGNGPLRRYVEGLMAVLQEVTGLPVIAKRDRDYSYDPHLPGSTGQTIRTLVDRLAPKTTDSQLYYWIREARRRHAGKPMRFCDLFPGYGMTLGRDGVPACSPTHRIEHFEFSAPIYCP